MRFVLLAGLLAGAGPSPAQDKAKAADPDAPSKWAAATKRYLMTRASFTAKDETVDAALRRLNRQLDGVETDTFRYRLDPAMPKTLRDLKVSMSVRNRPMDQIFNELLKGTGLGWAIVSNPKSDFDGAILIRAGTEKGEFTADDGDPKKKKK